MQHQDNKITAADIFLIVMVALAIFIAIAPIFAV
jgi:uncharacterized membrane protein YqiK